MGLKQLNAEVNDFERRRPAAMAVAIGALVCLALALAGGSWTVGIVAGVFVGVMRLFIRPIVAGRSVR